MKAIEIKNDGAKPEDMYIGEAPMPSVGDDEILVEVKAFGINRMDIAQRRGVYPPPPQAPKTLGVEFAGDIIDLGKDVKNHKKGDKVCGLVYGGCYAQYVVAHVGMTMPLPQGMDYIKGAAICEQWYTAFQALHLVAAIEKGWNVLIHGGASGVGLAAIQLAKLAGADKVFATAGTDEKARFIEKIGADQGINYKTQDFSEQVLKATDGKGVQIIIDVIGKDYWEKNVKSLSLDGRIVLLAMMSGSVVDKLDLSVIWRKRGQLLCSGLRTRSVAYQTNLANRFEREALPSLVNGKMKLEIAKVFPWDKVSEAHAFMEAAQNIGKIICTIP